MATRLSDWFFNWKIVWGLVGTTVLSLWQLHLFGLVYGLIALALIAATGTWLTSDAVTARDPKRLLSSRRLNPREKAKASLVYVCWKWGGVVVIVVLAITTTAFIRSHEEQMILAQPSGLLEPASDPNPQACSHLVLPEGVSAVYMGGSRFHASWFPHSPLLRQNNSPVLTIEKNERGNISLTLDIRSRDRKIVARIVKNEFEVNPNNALNRTRPDRSTLIVRDQEGVEVVNLRYLNPHAIRFSGLLYLSDPETRIKVGDAEIVMDISGQGELTVGGGCASYNPSVNGALRVP
jgi:hypothetical protein